MDQLIYINAVTPFVINTRYLLYIEPVANNQFNIVLSSGEKFQVNKQIMELLKDSCDTIIN